MEERRTITVSELNGYVKTLLESDKLLTSVYISGEISNFTNHYSSGHLYMSLKDDNALVRAVMFKGYASKLRFKPANGMKVIVRAKASLYGKDGSFQIYIESMEPDGIGALQMAYEQLKQKLAEEGLFDQSRKKPLPPFPKRVGVITSPTGAAVRDMLNVLGRRYPMAEVIFHPVLVQGEGAKGQIADALRRFNALRAADVILLGRGGGSIEELWAFNEEEVARAVAASDIPIISAVGHETDFTICDFVADMRAPTPSAAAELAVPDQNQLRHRLVQLYRLLKQDINHAVEQQEKRLTVLKSKRCLATPLFYVEEQAMRLDYLTRRFAAAGQQYLARGDRRVTAAAAKLDALSPLKVLSRGYAIATTESGVVKSVNDVAAGDEFVLQVADGNLSCQVLGEK
ncbi:MAG: exodeoxyribonuclease VII large subunit [Ruminococcaceae bacterium]|nr:exodeoxyribonuclease VII large subunit [Oscillospiraceae bacterium]